MIVFQFLDKKKILTDGNIHWKSLASKYFRAAVLTTIGTLNQEKK
jgi:hypothetical protein